MGENRSIHALFISIRANWNIKSLLQGLNICMYIHLRVCLSITVDIYIYIYIYIYRERERKREREKGEGLSIPVSLCIYIYIYIYTEREREVSRYSYMSIYSCMPIYIQICLSIYHHHHHVVPPAQISLTLLSPLLPIIHCFWQVFRVTSRILT